MSGLDLFETKLVDSSFVINEGKQIQRTQRIRKKFLELQSKGFNQKPYVYINTGSATLSRNMEPFLRKIWGPS